MKRFLCLTACFDVMAIYNLIAYAGTIVQIYSNDNFYHHNSNIQRIGDLEILPVVVI